MNASSLKAPFLFVGFLFGVLFKFWLVWESEISDATDDPHEYVLQILYPVNGGLAYGPGTGWIGRLFYDLGIPFRLGIEALFLLTIVLVLKALVTWPWQSRLSLALFYFTIFDPALAELFSHFLSDQIWLIETLIGISCLVFALHKEARPNWVLLNLAAFFFALSSLTRSLFIPLMVGLVVFGVFAGLLTFLKHRNQRPNPTLGVSLVSTASLLLVISLIYYGTCYYNFRSHGYFGISMIDSAEYKKFYFCLQSVGEPDGQRYFSIDEKRRRLIAQAGPESSEMIYQVEKDSDLKEVGLKNYGTADIATGWIQFALFGAAYQSCAGDLKKCAERFKTIESEIAEASRHGIITTRPIIPLPDSRVAIVAEAYPDGLLAAIRQIAHEPSASALAWNPELRYKDRDFTTALTRRTVSGSPIRNHAWNFLHGIYARLYTPFTVSFYLGVWLVFWALFASKWKRLPALSLSWMAQQLFGLFFIVWIPWYALFEASGFPMLSRYMIYNHVMLPLLLVYYLCAIVHLLREDAV